MQLSSILYVVPESTNDGSAFTGEKLKSGDHLLGRVLRLEPDGSAFIDLGRFRAKAKIGFPVQPGQTLKLQVVQGGTPLHLQVDVEWSTQVKKDLPQLNFTQVLSPNDQQQLVSTLDRMIQHAKAVSISNHLPERVQAALPQVKAIFDNIPMDKPMSQLVQWLQKAVEDRGVLFEKKLADAMVTAHPSSEGDDRGNLKQHQVRSVISRDLKPQLLVLKAFIEGGELPKLLPESVTTKDIEMTRQSIVKLLNHMVQQQERAVKNWREGDSFQIFTHMLPIEDQKLPVQIKIHYPKKTDRPKESDHQRIALLLQMDRIGPVRADLAMVNRHLKVQMFVHKDEIRQLFEQHMDAMAQALKGVFEEVVLETSVSEEKIVLFNQQGQGGASLGRIDIQV